MLCISIDMRKTQRKEVKRTCKRWADVLDYQAAETLIPLMENIDFFGGSFLVVVANVGKIVATSALKSVHCWAQFTDKSSLQQRRINTECRAARSLLKYSNIQHTKQQLLRNSGLMVRQRTTTKLLILAGFCCIIRSLSLPFPIISRTMEFSPVQNRGFGRFRSGC